MGESEAITYANEVAAHLWEMEVGEVRAILPFQQSRRAGGLVAMLECRGWFRGRHYLTEVRCSHPVTQELNKDGKRRRFLRKLGNPAAIKKLKPVDSV